MRSAGKVLASVSVLSLLLCACNLHTRSARDTPEGEEDVESTPVAVAAEPTEDTGGADPDDPPSLEEREAVLDSVNRAPPIVREGEGDRDEIARTVGGVFATATAVVGNVSLKSPDGAVRRLARGEALLAGDTLITGPASSIEIDLAGTGLFGVEARVKPGSILIGADSTLRVAWAQGEDPRPALWTITHEGGAWRASIVESSGDIYRVEVENASAIIELGEAPVDVIIVTDEPGDRTQILLRDGSVEIEAASEAITLHSAQQVSIVQRQAWPAQPLDEELWNRLAEALKPAGTR